LIVESGLVTGTTILAPLYMTDTKRWPRIVREVLLWAVVAMLVMVFMRAGLDKFDASSGWARAFNVWGYPVWFRILIGVLEIGAALLLLWPRTAAYGAAVIIIVMLGGMGTHVFVEHRPSGVTSELLHLIFACVVVAGRWRTRITPSAR
jgi:uncharacterized membrane protein YphA (DoxX/SURF4 family)